MLAYWISYRSAKKLRIIPSSAVEQFCLYGQAVAEEACYQQLLPYSSSGVTGMLTELISDHNIVFGFAICACQG